MAYHLLLILHMTEIDHRELDFHRSQPSGDYAGLHPDENRYYKVLLVLKMILIFFQLHKIIQMNS